MRSRSWLDGDRAKLLGISLALAAVAGVHAMVPVGTHPLHVIHVVLGALYFVPVAAAAIWFGVRGGLAASSAAAGLYLLHSARAWSGQPMENANQVATAALFVWFGAVTGTLARLAGAERGKRLAAERSAQRAGSIQAIASLAAALGFRDEGTRDHSERVAELAIRIASRLGWEGEPLEALRLAALVHDVGKIGVRDDVLLKAGTLGPEERARIERHPAIAADILRPVAGTGEIARIVLAHHEAPDGSGYPRGLAGEDIPEGARILRVADVYCALRESRTYKAPMPPGDAVRVMAALAGAKLDARAFEVLRALATREAPTLPDDRDARPTPGAATPDRNGEAQP